MTDTIVRPAIRADLVAAIQRHVARQLDARLQKHGPGAYAGPHEAMGIVEEEVLELKQAVVANDDRAVCDELIDIAVACIFGVASLVAIGRAGGFDD